MTHSAAWPHQKLKLDAGALRPMVRYQPQRTSVRYLLPSKNYATYASPTVSTTARPLAAINNSNPSESRLRLFLAQRRGPSFTTGRMSIAPSHEAPSGLQGLCFLALAAIATPGRFLPDVGKTLINGHAKMGWPRLEPVVNDGPTPPAAVKGHK